MSAYTQANRPIAVSTPLGPDTLLLISVAGEEALSALFRFELEMLALARVSVPFDQVLGQSVTVTLELPDGSTRPINGIVSSFCQAEVVAGAQGQSTFIRYHAELVPRLWLLTKNFQSRIFQHMSIPDILKQVLADLDVSFQIQGTFQPREYCVQYRESDFQFASRLMEEEGIYYYFQHTASGHTMVVANTPGSHADVPGPTPITFETVAGGTRREARITAWKKRQEVRSGKYTLWDHCFELPGKNLEAIRRSPQSVQVGTVSHSLSVANNGNLEIYEFPGDYAKRFDGIGGGGGEQAANLQKIFTDDARTAGIRMQEEAARAVTIAGQSHCQHLVAGHKFQLQGHFNADGPYVLTRVNHRAELKGSYTTTGAEAPFEYGNTFECIPYSNTSPFRPARTTRKARVEGPQTAVVVGPEGEEIFCDKYGRVKVQFLWDRQGQLDANSSCWLRVAQPLAGQGWGMITIPRIGQEVVVAFLEGDPDRPIITGSVYNAEQMPPFTLPDYRTKSAIKTHSYNKGHQNNFHGIAFEDTKGSEHLQIHSEKDMAITVEHDHRVHVPNNHITTVGGVFQVKSAGGGSGSGGGAGSGSGGDAGSGSGGDDAQSQPAWTVNPSPTQALGKSLSYTVGLSSSSVTGLSLSSTNGWNYSIYANPIGVLGDLPFLGTLAAGSLFGTPYVELTAGTYAQMNYGPTYSLTRGSSYSHTINPDDPWYKLAAQFTSLLAFADAAAMADIGINQEDPTIPYAIVTSIWTALFVIESLNIAQKLYKNQQDAALADNYNGDPATLFLSLHITQQIAALKEKTRVMQVSTVQNHQDLDVNANTILHTAEKSHNIVVNAIVVNPVVNPPNLSPQCSLSLNRKTCAHAVWPAKCGPQHLAKCGPQHEAR